jgi:hypothetical protein
MSFRWEGRVVGKCTSYISHDFQDRKIGLYIQLARWLGEFHAVSCVHVRTF